MNIHNIETTYRGARLQIEITVHPGRARLIINGIVRGEDSGARTLRLSSTVQTDYEWHELIEGIIRFDSGEITATITANNIEVAHQIFNREATSPSR